MALEQTEAMLQEKERAEKWWEWPLALVAIIPLLIICFIVIVYDDITNKEK